jgi:hypothetical protein
VNRFLEPVAAKTDDAAMQIEHKIYLTPDAVDPEPTGQLFNTERA